MVVVLPCCCFGGDITSVTSKTWRRCSLTFLYLTAEAAVNSATLPLVAHLAKGVCGREIFHAITSAIAQCWPTVKRRVASLRLISCCHDRS